MRSYDGRRRIHHKLNSRLLESEGWARLLPSGPGRLARADPAEGGDPAIAETKKRKPKGEKTLRSAHPGMYTHLTRC